MGIAPTAWEVAGLTVEEWLRHSLDVRIRIAAAPYMTGWHYAVAEPSVAYDSPAIPRSMIARNHGTNCSTMTASLLTSVFADSPWTGREYRDLQVFSDRLPDSPDSPIKAVERMGFGIRVNAPIAGRWHLVQGWRSLGSRPSGHAFLMLAERDGLTVLEVTSIANYGPRYKKTTFEKLTQQYSAALFLAVLPRV